MDTLDDLVELKRTQKSVGFQALVANYQKETERLQEKLFNRKTSDEEAIKLRAVLIEAKRMSPDTLMGELVRTVEERVEKTNAALGFQSR